MATTTTGPSCESAISQLGETAFAASKENHAPAFSVSTKQSTSQDIISQGRRKFLKRGWPTIAPFTNTEDAVMRKLIFLTGTIWRSLYSVSRIPLRHCRRPLPHRRSTQPRWQQPARLRYQWSSGTPSDASFVLAASVPVPP